VSLSIGRFGLDIPVESHDVVAQWSGNVLSLQGTLQGHDPHDIRPDGGAYTDDEILVLHQQLLGMVGGHEHVVPVLCDENTLIDGGWYRVLAADAGVENGSLAGAGSEWSCQLERIPNFQTALHHGFGLGILQENAHSLTTGVAFHAVPNTVAGYDLSAVTTAVTPRTRTGPDGGVLLIEETVNATGEFLYPIFALDAEHHYDMAATTRGGGYAVTDGQVEAGKNYTIENGLFRLSVTNPVGLFTPVFQIEGNDGTDWGTQWPFELGWWDGSAFVEFDRGHGWQVMKNTPGHQVIRQQLSGTSGTDRFLAAVSFGLRRGGHILQIDFDSRFSRQWGISFPAPAGTWSATNSGVQTGTNDVDTNRWALHSTAAFTTSSLGVTIHRDTAGRQWFAGLGMIRGGSGAAAPNRGTDLRDQFYAATAFTETVR
jgi:hypothetical protein